MGIKPVGLRKATPKQVEFLVSLLEDEGIYIDHSELSQLSAREVSAMIDDSLDGSPVTRAELDAIERGLR